MKHAINTCNDCPMYDSECNSCNHPKIERKGSCNVTDIGETGKCVPPLACPLRVEKLVLRLSKKCKLETFLLNYMKLKGF